MEHLFNLTNNPEVNNLIGNFVKVVNTNLEESIKNVKKKDGEYEYKEEESKYFTKSRVNELDEEDEEGEEGEEIEEEKLDNIDKIFKETDKLLKKYLIDKKGNNIADILSKISEKLGKN